MESAKVSASIVHNCVVFRFHVAQMSNEIVTRILAPHSKIVYCKIDLIQFNRTKASIAKMVYVTGFPHI